MLPVRLAGIQRSFRQATRPRFLPALLLRSPVQRQEMIERVKILTEPEEFDSLSDTFAHLNLRDEKSVGAFLDRLRPSERSLIFDIIGRKKTLQYEAPRTPVQMPVHYDELRSVWWINYLPYFLYGSFDMTTMLVAGESFDKVLGVQMGVSQLAGAAVGNLVSNGLGLAVVYYSASLVHHVRKPNLLPGQEEAWTVLWVQHSARVLGLVSGCLLGMFPLLFFDTPERPPSARSHEHDEAEEENAELERRETDPRPREEPPTDEWKLYGGNLFSENLYLEYERFKRDWNDFLHPTDGGLAGEIEDAEDARTTRPNRRARRPPSEEKYGDCGFC